MANPFDSFDNQPPALGAPSTAPVAGGGDQGGANPFDQFDGSPTAFGAPAASSETAQTDNTPPDASIGSIAKNIGTGFLAGIPNAESSLEHVINPAKPALDWLYAKAGIPNPTAGELVKKGLGLIGANPDNPDQTPQPQNAPERIGRMAGEGAAGMLLAPEAEAASLLPRAGQMVKNLIIGGGSGLGSGIGREVAPAGWEDVGGLAGGLIGGGTGIAASEVPSMVSSTAKHAADYVAPLTSAGREKMAGTTLAKAASDPGAVIDTIATAPREIVPGSSPTTFQLTGDMGLGGLERAVAAKNPGAFNDLRGEQNAARLDALSNVQAEGHPEAVSSFFRDQLDQLDKDTQAAHEAAAATARTATEGVGGGQGADVLGEQTRTALQGRLDDLKSQEGALWKSVDPGRTMITVASPVKQAFQGVYGNLTPEASIGLAPVEKQIGDIVSNYGQTLPLQNLVDLRSAVSSAMRDMKSPLQPNAQAYGRLTQLRSGIENAISDTVAQKAAQEQQAVATGAMQPQETMLQQWQKEIQAKVDANRASRTSGASGANPSPAVSRGQGILSGEMGAGSEASSGAAGTPSTPGGQGSFVDQATADRLKAATKATAERKQVFGAKPVSQIIQRPGNSMPYTMQPGSVASNVWKAGNGGGDALNAVLKASPEAVAPIRDIAAASLRSKAPDGIINAKHLDAWKAQHGPALAALEKAAAGSTAVFETAAKAGDHLAEVAAQRKATIDAYQKSAVGRLLKIEDPADVVKTVGSIFNRADAVKEMRSLALEASKDPQAMEGLRKSVVEFMKDRLISNTEAATSGKNLIKADAFQAFIAKNHTALRQVFNDQEIGAMRAIAQDLKRANRSITAAKLPGGSNTAQDLAAMSEYDLKQSLLSKLVTHGASIAGGAGAIGGWPGALIGGLGSKALLEAREAGIKSVEDMVQKAMLDPDLARTLLMKAPKKLDTGSELTLAAKLRRMAVVAGVQNSPARQ